MNENKKNLLIIEDEENCAELCGVLKDIYNIQVIKDIAAASEIFEDNKEKINALLISAGRREDLFAAVKVLNSTTRLSSIPILLIVGEDVPDDRLECLGSSVVDCISKPYNGRIIANRIENAIALKDSMTFNGIEKMLKQLPSNIYLKDNEGRYVFATKYWHHLKDADKDPNWTIRGKTDPEIRKDKENAEEALKKDLEIIKSGKGTSYTIEINADGKKEFLQVIKHPVFNDDGCVNGIIGLINDVTEFELLKKKLREKAITDEMTGVYNRAYFNEFILLNSNELYPFGLISADCDGLKYINDTFGHMAGDEYIKSAVTLFHSVLPETSFLFRMGGDEFLIILPSASEESTERLVNELKEKQKQYVIEGKQLSISFGVSVINSRGDDFEARLAESDRNMYVEKRRKKENKR